MSDLSLEHIKDFLKELQNKKITNLIICGIETHICIQQTAIDLQENGFNVSVVADATATRNKIDYQLSIDFMRSRKIKLYTVESILFEICTSAENQNFRQLSKLIK